MALEVFKVSVKRKRMPTYQTVKPLVVGLVLRKKMREAKEVIELAKKKSQEYRLSAWRTLEVVLMHLRRGLFQKMTSLSSGSFVVSGRLYPGPECGRFL